MLATELKGIDGLLDQVRCSGDRTVPVVVTNCKDWGERQRYAMKGETPKRFERLCLRDLTEGVIREPKAAELLGVSVHDLDRRIRRQPSARLN